MWRKILFLSLFLLPMISWGQYYSISCDSQQPNEQFVLDRVFSGNTPMLRSYHYDSGVAVDLTPWAMEFYYSYGQYDTNGGVTIPGVVSLTNRVTYLGATNVFFQPYDKYYFSIKGTHTDGYVKTFATGKMIQDYDPGTDTNLTTLMGQINMDWWTNNIGLQVESNRARIAVFETSKVDRVAFDGTNLIFEGRIASNEAFNVAQTISNALYEVRIGSNETFRITTQPASNALLQAQISSNLAAQADTNSDFQILHDNQQTTNAAFQVLFDKTVYTNTADYTNAVARASAAYPASNPSNYVTASVTDSLSARVDIMVTGKTDNTTFNATNAAVIDALATKSDTNHTHSQYMVAGTNRFDEIYVAPYAHLTTNLCTLTDGVYTGAVTSIAYTGTIDSVRGRTYLLGLQKQNAYGTSVLTFAGQTLTVTAAGLASNYVTSWSTTDTNVILTLWGDGSSKSDVSNVYVKAFTNGDASVAGDLAVGGDVYLGKTNSIYFPDDETITSAKIVTWDAAAIAAALWAAVSNQVQADITANAGYTNEAHTAYGWGDWGTNDLNWGAITGTPDTISGYGITDAYTKVESDASYATGTPVYAESDPVYTASVASTITSGMTSSWEQASSDATSWTNNKLAWDDGGDLTNVTSTSTNIAIADLTDGTNVTLLSDQSVTNTDFDTRITANAGFTNVADTAMQDVVDDTTPTLGGNLDGGGNKVTNAVWEGMAVGDAFLTKTGDWTGQFDSQEGSYYLNYINITNKDEVVTNNETGLTLAGDFTSTGTLDGEEGAAFHDAANLTGNIPVERITNATATGSYSVPAARIDSGDIAAARMTVNALVLSDFTANGEVPVGTGAGAFQMETGVTFHASVGLAIDTDVQAYDAALKSIADNTGTAADKGIYYTGENVAAEFALSSYARSYLDDTNEALFKATVNLESGVDYQVWDAGLDTLASGNGGNVTNVNARALGGQESSYYYPASNPSNYDVGTITGGTVTAGASDTFVVTGPNAAITWDTNAATGGGGGSGLPDYNYDGDTTTVTGRVYQQLSDKTWQLAVHTNEDLCNKYIGISYGTNSTLDGMVVLGAITVTNGDLVAGSNLYVGATAGLWTHTVPTNDGYFVRAIGYATDTNEIYVVPCPVYLEVGDQINTNVLAVTHLEITGSLDGGGNAITNVDYVQTTNVSIKIRAVTSQTTNALTYNITGVGFRPKGCRTFAAIANTYNASWGEVDSLGAQNAIHALISYFTWSGGSLLKISPGAGTEWRQVWVAWTDDGMTVSNTITGNIVTNTIYVNYTFFR